MAYLLAMDQGTTSSRAIIFDETGRLVASSQQEFQQHYPKPGWVEHDALEIWFTQSKCVQHALEIAGLKARDIAGIGITNQRETTVLWDRLTGTPICRAIVWQDRRTAGMCDALGEQGHADMIRQKTGLEVDSYFSGTKLSWMLDNVPGARARAERGELAFGTIDSWLIWRLTGGRVHVTDASNASRTLLFNINTLQWDAQLLSLLRIPESLLPTVTDSSAVVGDTDASLFGGSIPIAAAAGDQQAATFGQTCFAPGEAKNTYGTGCFMLLNTGTTPVRSAQRLLTTIGWRMQGQTTYMLEGSVFMAGAVVQWLRDGLQLFKSSAEVEELAMRVPDTDGVVLVPAFAGLGAPHWDAYARGTLIGMTRGTTQCHIARAALESIALQTVDLVSAMQKDGANSLAELRVDGGAARNDLLMQMQADVLGVSVVRPDVTETTALGVAYLAGLAVGVYRDLNELKLHWKVQKRFEPKIGDDQREAMLNRWHRAVERARSWEIA
jgi:glycerol kinase